MRDERPKVFRAALDGVIESLDAHVRIARWTDSADVPPEPLRAAAARLVERLGVADRISSKAFTGSPADTTRVNAICATLKRLDATYVAYRKQVEREPDQKAAAVAVLEADIAEAVAALRG
jgi:hypothetical protein